MKDLILINPQNHYRGEVNPIGILNIKSVCDQLGYDVEILDMAKLQREENIPYNEKIFEWMEKIFKNLKARCYGISVMNASMFWGKTIAEIIRRYNSKAIIFAGGPQVTALKERIFEEGQEFDYLLLYEGEKGVPEFLKFIASDDKILPTNVLAKNLCNKDAYHIKMTAIDINNIKMIDYSNYLKQKIIDIEVGRGCPYHCYYCSANELVGTNVRYKDIHKILDECQWVYDHMEDEKKKLVNFNHDNFLSNKNMFKKFVNEKRKGNYSFEYGCEGRIDAVDDEIIKLLHESNCKYFFVGIETGSARIQKICRKGLNLSTVADKVKKITNLGIEMEANFIVGFPEETEEDVQETIRFATELSLISPIMKVNYSIMSPEPCTDVEHNTDLTEYVLLRENIEYKDLLACGISVEKLNPIFYNNMYTIRNKNYDIVYYAKCTQNYFDLLHRYHVFSYIFFIYKKEDIWTTFMRLGQYENVDQYVGDLMKAFENRFSDVETEVIRFERDCNLLKVSERSTMDVCYSYPVPQIYKDFLKNTNTYWGWNNLNKKITRIKIRKNENE